MQAESSGSNDGLGLTVGVIGPIITLVKRSAGGGV